MTSDLSFSEGGHYREFSEESVWNPNSSADPGTAPVMSVNEGDDHRGFSTKSVGKQKVDADGGPTQHDFHPQEPQAGTGVEEPAPGTRFSEGSHFCESCENGPNSSASPGTAPALCVNEGRHSREFFF